VLKEFNLINKNITLLSRCVKCNCPQIVLVSREKALILLSKITLKSLMEDIKEFWAC
jgi:hypothetical protein